MIIKDYSFCTICRLTLQNSITRQILLFLVFLGLRRIQDLCHNTSCSKGWSSTAYSSSAMLGVGRLRKLVSFNHGGCCLELYWQWDTRWYGRFCLIYLLDFFHSGHDFYFLVCFLTYGIILRWKIDHRKVKGKLIPCHVRETSRHVHITKKF